LMASLSTIISLGFKVKYISMMNTQTIEVVLKTYLLNAHP